MNTLKGTNVYVSGGMKETSTRDYIASMKPMLNQGIASGKTYTNESKYSKGKSALDVIISNEAPVND